MIVDNKVFAGYELVELEIGYGTSSLLFGLARLNPTKYYVGIEKDSSYYINSSLRFSAPNLEFLLGDARELVKEIDDQRLNCVHLYFPSPYPIGDRLFNFDFYKNLYRIVKLNGIVKVVTDHTFYFYQIQRAFNNQCWKYRNWSKLGLDIADNLMVGTACERKYGAKYFIEVIKVR